MKKLVILAALVALLVIVVLLLWPHSRDVPHSTTAYTTVVELSGTPGAAFTGEYLRDGKRITIAGVLPWSLAESNISRLEIRKAKPDDTLHLEAHGGGQSVSMSAAPGAQGVRLTTEAGWGVEIIR